MVLRDYVSAFHSGDVNPAWNDQCSIDWQAPTYNVIDVMVMIHKHDTAV